jgi:hypothetical protein
VSEGFKLRVGDRTRTGDNQIHSEAAADAKPFPANGLGQADPALTPHLHTDPGLARVIAAWEHLAPAIRAAVLALVNAGSEV